jgi:hypothetical protein
MYTYIKSYNMYKDDELRWSDFCSESLVYYVLQIAYVCAEWWEISVLPLFRQLWINGGSSET